MYIPSTQSHIQRRKVIEESLWLTDESYGFLEGVRQPLVAVPPKWIHAQGGVCIVVDYLHFEFSRNEKVDAGSLMFLTGEQTRGGIYNLAVTGGNATVGEVFAAFNVDVVEIGYSIFEGASAECGAFIMRRR